MIVLTIGNSESSIAGLDIKEHRILAKVLSYTLNPTASYFSGRGPQRISLLSKKGVFPTGLLYLVREYLGDKTYREDDFRVEPKTKLDLNATFEHTPYDVQVEAAEACSRHHRGIVVAPTGVGKSLICALIIEKLQVSTLIVVPNLELKRQLTESLEKIFGYDKVGHNKDIAVYNIDSVKCTRTYDAVIIDEFHHAAAKTYRKLNTTKLVNTYYRLGLTATPFRSQDNEKLLLESVLSEVIYRVDYNKAVEQGFIVPMESFYVEVPKTAGIDGNWAEVYHDLVVYNDIRNALIGRLVTSLCSGDSSVLCLVKELAHGEAISKLSSTHFANGLNDDTALLINAFSVKRINSLIGTVGVVGEGVDTKACEYVIVAGLGRSRNAFMQQCGRAFRRYPGKESAKVIIFYDPSHKFTRNHFREQCKILKEEYGLVPTKLILD